MTVKAWWWKGVPNFGDLLTPHILRTLAEVETQWVTPIGRADVVAVGSVLGLVPRGWSGTVLGSGKLCESDDIDWRLVQANVMALRGPLTARGIPGVYALGDMGLLASDLVRTPSRHHNLGIVPHWSDSDLKNRQEFSRYQPVVIDPRLPPLEVVARIGQCRKIVTSSLHALIVADSFGIPRRFEYTPRFDHEGGTFKFRDYSASINTPFEVGKLIKASRFHVEKVQHELYDVLQAYRGLVHSAVHPAA